MQQLITLQHLQELGIDLNDTDADALVAHLNEQLEERIGVEITDSLDDEQLKRLVELQKEGDDEIIGAWLEENVPELQQIAEDERDVLLGDLAENADDILKNM
ncbi:hypothetical protein EOL96_09215 [Candidatus Saccharibacteria bacterium]|nr:hypothetical protein [Candidatus Saccharibacteria bacterium]